MDDKHEPDNKLSDYAIQIKQTRAQRITLALIVYYGSDKDRTRDLLLAANFTGHTGTPLLLKAVKEFSSFIQTLNRGGDEIPICYEGS